MALRVLDQVSSQRTELSASVCIVGAGVAGLIVATRLARIKKLRIVVVESGLKTLDPSISALNEVDNAGDNYNGALLGRCRGLGGTSLLWSGRLLPLAAHDTLPRPYLGLEGWPFDSAELDQYRQEIEALMGVDSEPYDGDIVEQLDPQALLPRHDIDFCLRWAKRPTRKNHNLAYVLRNEIERLENLEIWLGATASHFDFDLDRGKIKALTCINLAGKTLRLMASEFLIAAGTLETTRLLLLADRQSNDSISRDCNALGRYFNDHLGVNAATIRPRDNTLTNRTLNDRTRLKSLRHLHFELRQEVQKKHGIASAYFEVGRGELPDSSALVKTKQFMQRLRRGQVAISYEDIRAILQDSPSLFRAAQWRWMQRQYYWPPNADLHIVVRIEQLPQWQNRISLSDKEDALHLPKLRLEWKKTDADEKVFRVTIEKIDCYWKAHLAQVCDLEWKPEVLNPEVGMVHLTMDLAHPAGSTRMGTIASNSVVDRHLRVHRIENLSIASASVFPSSGSANPTLTIMHLAMRAADAVAKHI
jgi:choline dehydrogenase-like flavoprotein